MDPTSSSTDTSNAPKPPNPGDTPKAIIKNVDMSEELQTESVEITTGALEKFNIEKDIAAHIKKEFDRRHGPTWHVVVGKNFGSYVTHEPEKCRLTLLGTLVKSGEEQAQAIIRLEKTAFAVHNAGDFFTALTRKVEVVQETDIYSWFAAWLAPSADGQPQGDVKVNVICPATEIHIRKYTKQDIILVSETPELFKKIVEPYIDSFPVERTRWVHSILTGTSESSKILFSSSQFVILPDMKWDLHTIESLYLVAIIRSPPGDTLKLRCLRDLRAEHIPLLRSIKREAQRVVGDKWGEELGKLGLRFYVHYQPSYYHFHVHIVNAKYEGGGGIMVGQAHLLEDVISLLEIDGNIFEKRTITYGLGDQHGLYEALRLRAAQN